MGEKSNLKHNFWDVCFPLPNLICLDFISLMIPSVEISQLRGKLLYNDPTAQVLEFKFYTRKKFNQKDQNHMVDPL